MSDQAVRFALDFTYEEAEQPALHNAEGEIKQGTCVVLCGSSGCGKSTLLRCMNQLIPQFYEGTLTGFCQISDQNLEGLTIGETGKLTASVFQDPRSQFFTLNSNTEVAFSLENFGLSRAEITSRVDAAFDLFHLEHLRNRNVFHLSSGERQLLAILSAWAANTDLLLLDEPTANLDYDAIEQLSRVLLQLKQEGKTLLISEHRLSYLTQIADEYWLMENGQIVKRYPANVLVSLSPEELKQLGLRTTDWNTIAYQPQPPMKPSAKDTLLVHNLSYRYGPKSPQILRDISFEAHTGEVLSLLGANGCGKTTLGKLISGLLKPVSGSILWNGRKLSEKAASQESIFIMQEAEFQFFTNSVLNEVSYGIPDTPENQDRISSLLQAAGLWSHRDQHPFSLSGGQMQRLVLLLACLTPKPIVVLDEPTAGLDYKSLTICAELIRRMQRDKLVILISHDPELLSMVCTRSLILSDGLIQEEVVPSDQQTFTQMLLAMRRHTVQRPKTQQIVKPPPRRIDPRAKLVILLVSMLIALGTNLPLIFSVLAVIIAAALYEKDWKLPAAIVGSIGLLYGIDRLFPSVATSFLLHFFPRMIVIGAAAALIIAPDEGPRFLAGIRAVHIPERINMIISVILRFFPVLHTDLSIMSQSIRTRGFFKNFREKLKAAPEYLEILIVPMVFRVLRIAEALSSSAETRGISLPGRRSSYTAIQWTVMDTVILILLTAAVIFGLTFL